MAWDLWTGAAAYTALCVGGTAWRIHGAVQKVAGAGEVPDPSSAGVHVLQALLESRLSVILLYNLAGSCFVLLSLAVKTLFFGSLSMQEGQKLAERLLNYVLFKVLFLMAAVQLQNTGGLWLLWFAVLGFLKIFAGLARDRFERLCASPAASLSAHARTIVVLLLVLCCNALFICTCATLLRGVGLSKALLLSFEAFIITIDACQTLAQYGFHLAEAYSPLAEEEEEEEQGGVGGSSRAAVWAEWRMGALFHINLACDLLSLLLTLAHYAHVWWLHGLAFQLVDGLLFLNMRALLAAIVRRLRSAVRYVRALRSLRSTFPDASEEQLLAFADDCAICKEPMAAAKRLPCKHLFHLSCLRSWLDQGSPSTYSCPTCRSPLLAGNEKPSVAAPTGGVGLQTPAGGSSTLSAAESADGATVPGQDSGGGGAGGGSSSIGAGAGGVQTNAGLLGGLSSEAAVRLDWWWPFGPPEGAMEGASDLVGGSAPVMTSGGLRWRNHGRSGAADGWDGARAAAESSWRASQRFDTWRGTRAGARGEAAALLARHRSSRVESMAQQVEEILPHMSRELIVQDLQQTNSVATTVNRLLGEG